MRGKQPVILCPARSIEGMRPAREWTSALSQGRILVLSPFGRKHRRPTVETAQVRNLFVASIKDGIFVAHAERGSKTEQLCRKILTLGKPLLMLGVPVSSTSEQSRSHLRALLSFSEEHLRTCDEWIGRTELGCLKVAAAKGRNNQISPSEGEPLAE